MIHTTVRTHISPHALFASIRSCMVRNLGIAKTAGSQKTLPVIMTIFQEALKLENEFKEKKTTA
jgi:hypothetical protein